VNTPNGLLWSPPTLEQNHQELPSTTNNLSLPRAFETDRMAICFRTPNLPGATLDSPRGGEGVLFDKGRRPKGLSENVINRLLLHLSEPLRISTLSAFAGVSLSHCILLIQVWLHYNLGRSVVASESSHLLTGSLESKLNKYEYAQLL
jgi:hypothetical protein